MGSFGVQDMRNLRKKRCALTPRFRKYNLVNGLFSRLPWIHPDHSVVLPLAPEPIRKEDGATKSDCERNAAKRLLDDLRRDHPRLKAIIVEDALGSNAPHITHLKNKGFRYILGAKPGDHKLLFSSSKPVNPRNHGRPETKKPAPYTISNGTSDYRSTMRSPT